MYLSRIKTSKSILLVLYLYKGIFMTCKIKKTIFMLFILLLPQKSLSKTTDLETFRLYKINHDKQFDYIQKYHVATFDTIHGLEYNQSNCEMFKNFLIRREKNFAERIYSYVCEFGAEVREGIIKK